MAVFWGMFAYSVAVLGIVVGLAVKLALLFRDRGELRRKLDEQERQTKTATEAAEASRAMLARYRKEVEVLREELDESDGDLDPSGVAERLERLLSGEVPKDGSEDAEGRGAVPATDGPDTKPGDV